MGFDLSVLGGFELDEIGSPSHVVRVRPNGGGGSSSVSLNAEKDIPNRDLVVDVKFRTTAPLVWAGRTNDGKGHFAAMIPSSAFGSTAEAPRRVVILLDRSGSMQGEPLSQACKAIAACLAVLSDSDTFGLVAFDNETVQFRSTLAPGTRAMRDEAQMFLKSVSARGGTELAKGFREAAKLLEEKGGDVFILTDGQVSGTEQILAAARKAGVRLHCLGIGSASKDRFLTLLSRETGGVSRFVTARERVDLSAVDLFASMGRPVAEDLKASANIQPEPSAMVFSGTPVLLFGQEAEARDNQIELTWSNARLGIPVDFNDNSLGETVHLLQGARLITDWESRYPAANALAPLERRKQDRVAARLLALSEEYSLASREMSLVSVVTRDGDRPGELPETRVVPLGMPQDTAFKAYFLAGAAPDGFTQFFAATPAAMNPAKPGAAAPERGIMAHLTRPMQTTPISAEPKQETTEDILLELASRMESDGGMPGKNAEARAGATLIAVLAFVSQGHTATRGAFRSHVVRLLSFLKSLNSLSHHYQQIAATVVEQAESGTAPAGEWLKLACASSMNWKDLAKSVGRS